LLNASQLYFDQMKQQQWFIERFDPEVSFVRAAELQAVAARRLAVYQRLREDVWLLSWS
jgi:hypothetical protein